MPTEDAFLSGRRIAITRAGGQAGGLPEKLAALGAEVLDLPLIKISAEIDKHNLAECMLELGGYDWIVFTSANGVRFFFEQYFKLFDDIRSLGLLRIACIGESTARVVHELHLKVECMPAKATAEALAEALAATGSLDSAKVLLITGNMNRESLEQKLEEARAIVDRLQVYKTEKGDLAGEPAADIFRSHGADAVLFASSSAVDSYAAQVDTLKLAKGAKKPLLGSIGHQTSESLRKNGLPVDFEARTPSLDALVEALVEALPRKPGHR
ncbi:MAG: uroporphyrinogen-III synthase [Opitutaceae bacterium]|jgi:uroporphyrinogen-III synthase